MGIGPWPRRTAAVLYCVRCWYLSDLELRSLLGAKCELAPLVRLAIRCCFAAQAQKVVPMMFFSVAIRARDSR